MAYDEALADRVRERLAGEPALTDAQLAAWVERGGAVARSLPPK